MPCPVKAMYHMAGFLGEHVLVFDIVGFYPGGGGRNMALNKIRFGSANVMALSSESDPEGEETVPGSCRRAPAQLWLRDIRYWSPWSA